MLGTGYQRKLPQDPATLAALEGVLFNKLVNRRLCAGPLWRGLLAMLASVLWVSCGEPRSTQPGDTLSAGPNLLLITIDTLRADHLGSYGYEAVETPNLDRLAGEGVLFEQAASVAPLTLPAHASMLTGQYPFQHGVRDNHNFILADEALTLPEILASAGYATGGFIGAFVLREQTGIAQGFERFTDFAAVAGEPSLSVGYELQRPAEAVVAEALPWIKEQAGPFFAWVHLFDPHLPYAPPPPYDQRYADALYDGEIAYVDEVVGDLIRGLEESGKAAETLVVVVADHGEGLGKHGEQRHAFLIYDETVRVPLILWAPGSLPEALTVGGQASVVDLLPTMLSLLAVPDPAGATRDGIDLRRLIADPSDEGAPAYAEAVTPLIEFGWSELRAVRAGGYKYIAAPRPELYDLGSDPGETENIFDAVPRRAAAMRDQLEAWTADDDLERMALGRSFVDPQALEHLRSLGYIAGGGPVRRAAAGGATSAQKDVDPKHKVKEFEGFQDGLRDVGRALAAGNWAAAETAIAAMDRHVPSHHLVHYYRGRLELLQGNAAAAIDDLQRAIELAPAHALAYGDLATAYRTFGETQRSIEILRLAMDSFPEAPSYPFMLGSLLHENGQLDEALEAYLVARRFEPPDPRLLGNLSHVYFLRQEYEQAAALMLELIEMQPEDPEPLYRLGLVERRQGHAELAAEWFRRALEIDPDHAPAKKELDELSISGGV